MKLDASGLSMQRKPIYTKCDECGQMFALNLKERNLPKGGKWAKERYFVCPVCGHKYRVCRFDKNGVHERTRNELDKRGEVVKD